MPDPITIASAAGGSADDYAVGMKHAAEQKWIEVDRSGTRIVLLPDGAE